MGLYRDQVLPRLVDWACSTPEMRDWRSAVTAGLAGRIVEVGFGSGLNLEVLPPEVEAVLAVEPARAARRLAARRSASAEVPVDYIGLDGEELPLADASCDGALSTFTLCTIAHPERALAEIRRVLRPGGELHFLEHGLSPEAHVARMQRGLEPFQRLLAGGCHLTRDACALVRAADFELLRCEQRYARGPKPWSWFSLGVARRPDD